MLLSFILIISTSGCYSLHNLTRNDIQYENRTMYFLHGPQTFYRLTNVIISDGVLTGTINYIVSNSDKSNTIHIYIAPDSSLKRNGDQIQVPYENIVKAEIYKVDGLKSIVGVVGSVGGLLAVLLIKGASCPFIYTSDGTDYHFTGEIYSGATALPLERDDYLPISNCKPEANKYKLRITNEVDEIQKTNLTELVLIDHQPDTKILMDKNGTAYSVSDPEIPASALNNYGNSIRTELAYCDSLRYMSTIKKDQNIIDTISLTFDKPALAKSSRLVIKGKNTMWLDYMYARFNDLFGKRLEKWKEETIRNPGRNC